MGIPSYYKRLADSIKGLVIPHRSGSDFKCGTLLFDFNCMIYQIIRDPERRPFPGYHSGSDAEAWEQECCQAVVDYTVNIWKELGKPKQVFLGIDGVVPMAKIRQQRLRRFKSVWTAEQELTRGIRQPGETRWDTNAITPGTAFMERLGSRLATLCKTHGWTLSDASQPGEGEQKCMAFWRGLPSSNDPVVIYGLDADLILLCLLTRAMKEFKGPVWCFRESAEWESANAPFMRLSIDKLDEVLRTNSKLDALQWTMDYIGAMSFLGNDFVPHGLSLKIREGGHDRMIAQLKALHAGGMTFTKKQDGIWQYNLDAVRILVSAWSTDEEVKLKEFMKNKKRRVNYEEWDLQPCVCAVEEKVLGDGKGGLRADWRECMLREWFGEGVSWSSICNDYTSGLQWILDYYTAQRAVAKTWIYPWSLPPAWSELSKNLDKEFQAPTVSEDSIQPKEQLAMVLPLESWHLIRDKKLASMPTAYPHFWPKKYGFFSAGKIFMWECEAELPLIHLPAVRSLI